MLKSLAERALDLLFPRRCVGCGTEGGFLCSSCLASVKSLSMPWCVHCGRPWRESGLCTDCRVRPRHLAGIRAAFRYEGPVREAILQFKYHGVSAMADELAGPLQNLLAEHPLAFDVIVPVPLAPDRLRERGYNQAEALARRLGKALDKPVVPGLVRTRSTRAQALLRSWEERYNNVAGAFRADPALVTGRRILVVDDVCTTGATLESCGEALKAAGATTAWGLALAREV